MKAPELYNYRATVVSVYDGDTITVDVDLGFRLKSERMKLRLYGIDTPEMRGAEKAQGTVVRDWLREQILNKQIVMKTYRDSTGKYGRYLATIYIEDETTGELRNLNDELLQQPGVKPYLRNKG